MAAIVENNSGIKIVNEKYHNNRNFRELVNVMLAHIERCNYTAAEIRQAALMASIIYDRKRIARAVFSEVPESVANALESLEKWMDSPLE